MPDVATRDRTRCERFGVCQYDVLFFASLHGGADVPAEHLHMHVSGECHSLLVTWLARS